MRTTEELKMTCLAIKASMLAKQSLEITPEEHAQLLRDLFPIANPAHRRDGVFAGSLFGIDLVIGPLTYMQKMARGLGLPNWWNITEGVVNE